MAGVKITDLPLIEFTPDANDVLPIVDVDADITKRVTVTNLLSSISIQAENAQDAEKIRVTETDASGTFYLHFGANITAYDSVLVDDELSYDAENNILTAGFFSGNGSQLTDVIADSAVNASFALNALYADQAGNALTADSATNATFASKAVNADSAVNASFALTADAAQSAQVADSAVNASFALLASSAISADSAVNATFANTSLTALRALAADSAVLAQSATNALFAQIAVSADSAANATFAINASAADFAAFADSCQRAAQANIATFALASANDLVNIYDSGDGVRITGDTTIDSDLFVKGRITGDGSGLINVSSVTNALVTDQIDANVVDSSGLHFLMLRSLSTGYDSVSTKSTITFDPTTDTLSSTRFSGDGSGLTNVSALRATNAETVDVSTVSDSATYYIHMGSTASGNDNVNVDTNLTYNPQRNSLKTSIFGTNNWEMYESAGDLVFANRGVKKAKIDSDGNIYTAGTLFQSQTL